MALGSTLLLIIESIIAAYGALTSWIYALFQRPELILEQRKRIRAEPTKSIQEGDTEVTYKPIPVVKKSSQKLLQSFDNAKCETMAQAWDWSVKRYKSKNLLGTRDVVGEEDEVQPNG